MTGHECRLETENVVSVLVSVGFVIRCDFVHCAAFPWRTIY
jgi:hypothetical protein